MLYSGFSGKILVWVTAVITIFHICIAKSRISEFLITWMEQHRLIIQFPIIQFPIITIPNVSMLYSSIIFVQNHFLVDWEIDQLLITY